MSTEKIKSFFSAYNSKSLSRGESIITPGNTDKNVYYLSKGYIRQYAVSHEGVEANIHMLSPGSIFPMNLVLNDTPNRHFYAAQTDSHVHVIPVEDAYDFLHSDPEVISQIARRLMKGLDRLSIRTEQILFAPAKLRIISSLLWIARHLAEDRNGEKHINIRFTHEDIGKFAGVSRETVSRELDKLRREELIDYDTQSIRILDVDKMSSKLKSLEIT